MTLSGDSTSLRFSFAFSEVVNEFYVSLMDPRSEAIHFETSIIGTRSKVDISTSTMLVFCDCQDYQWRALTLPPIVARAGVSTQLFATEVGYPAGGRHAADWFSEREPTPALSLSDHHGMRESLA